MPGASQQPHPAACAPLKGVILMKSNRKTIVLLPIVGILALLVVIGWVIHIAREKIMQASVDSFEEQEVDGSDTEVDKILLDTGDGQMWIPVLADVPACTRVPEQHVLRNGEVFYLENNQITSKIGIDVSAYQGNIDWQTVREAGIDRHALILAGDFLDSAYETSRLYDPAFETAHRKKTKVARARKKTREH